MGAMLVEDQFLEDLVADFRFIQVRSSSFSFLVLSIHVYIAWPITIDAFRLGKKRRRDFSV